MEITIDVTGEAEIQRKLSTLKTNIIDMYGTFRDIGQAFKEYYSEIPVRSRGTVFGRPWEPLSPSYDQWKRDNHPGKPMMVLSGKLMNSYEFTATRNQVRLFNTVDYFRDHQQGIGVPQRVLMALTKERINAATEIAGQDIKRKVEQA